MSDQPYDSLFHKSRSHLSLRAFVFSFHGRLGPNTWLNTGFSSSSFRFLGRSYLGEILRNHDITTSPDQMEDEPYRQLTTDAEERYEERRQKIVSGCHIPSIPPPAF
jgi:hypothetical protein